MSTSAHVRGVTIAKPDSGQENLVSDSRSNESTATVVVAISVNLAIAAAKAVVAAITGSAAMTAEAIHSFVDTANEGILLFGIRRSRREPNEQHPFGYGRELYFWTLLVAVLIFGVGGGVTILEGVDRLVHPHDLEDALWTYVVLGVAFALESYSFVVSYRAVMRDSHGRSVLATIHASKDPTTFTVLVEDSAALVGLTIAFVGTVLGHVLQNRYIDGIASIAIGLVLASVSIFLASESRALLVGESAEPKTIDAIRSLVTQDDAVVGVERAIAMQLAPHTIVLFLDVHFHDDLSLEAVIAAIQRIEATMRKHHADVATIFIEPTLPASRGSGELPTATARRSIAAFE